MIKKITFLFFLLVSSFINAQVGVGTKTPNSNSVLEVSSDTKGILITKVALVETTNPAPLSSHVAGMIIYNTAPSGSGDIAVFQGFYYNDGKQWIRLEPLSTAIGDIKHSILTEDHNGWYLLNGRSKATLSANAQLNATAIGFGVNIPNATDKFLKGKSASEALMNTGGSNSVVLTQANLPNVTFNGTANSSGSHTHDFTDRHHSVPEDLNLVTGLLGILSGVVLNIMNNYVGEDTVTTSTVTSTSAGNHNHTATVNTGGSAVPLNNVSHLVTNTFVYLGK